jgi:hypothetical protein
MFPDSSSHPVSDPRYGGEDDSIHLIESQANIAAALPAHLVHFERFPNCRHAVGPQCAEPTIAMII